MEPKKARVTKLTKRDKDSYGKFAFTLEFDNGDKGFYNTTNGDQTFFVAGNVADYFIEAKTSKQNTTYYVITHPEDQKAAPQGKGGGGFRVDPKVQLAGYAASYAKDLVVAGRVDYKDFESCFNNIHRVMSAKV